MKNATARVAAIERMLTVMVAAAFHQTSTFLFVFDLGFGAPLNSLIQDCLDLTWPRRDWMHSG
jgi:hypothetical protein